MGKRKTHTPTVPPQKDVQASQRLFGALFMASSGKKATKHQGIERFFLSLANASDDALLLKYSGLCLWRNFNMLPIQDALRAYAIIAAEHPAVMHAPITPSHNEAEHTLRHPESLTIARALSGLDEDTFNQAKNYSFIKSMIRLIDRSYGKIDIYFNSNTSVIFHTKPAPIAAEAMRRVYDDLWSPPAGYEGWDDAKKYRFLQAYLQRNDAQDMLRDVTHRLLNPMATQIAADLGISDDEAAKTEIYLMKDAFLHHLASRCASASEAISLLDNLSRSWHHTANQTATPPRYHVPEGMPDSAQHDRRWHPLMSEPFVTSEGYRIVNLTNKKQLAQESNQLGHCVRGYDVECTGDNPSHIFSIRDAHGHSLSTFEIRESHAERAEFEAQINGKKRPFRVVQHEGKDINGSRDYITRGALHLALQEWIKAAQSRPGFLNPPPYGETPESKAVTDLPDEIKNAGYYPSWHNINLALAEFKKDMRRGADAQDAQGRLVFHDTITEDGYRHGTPQHLIDGAITTEGGQHISLRDLNAQDWLRASGLLDAVVNELCLEQPEKEEAFKAKLLEMKAQPYDVRKPGRQIAHAYHAGTLDGQKVAHLPPEERDTYARRIARSREDMPYFDRASVRK